MATIISFIERKQEREALQKLGADSDFTSLFRMANELRRCEQSEPTGGELYVCSRAGYRALVHRQIADRVFTEHLFSYAVLVQISYVADLLVRYRGLTYREVTLARLLTEYAEHDDPAHLLAAAEQAFLMFTFFAHTRPRRVVEYTRYARAFGTSAYALYGDRANKPLGKFMAEAFVPLGTIARELFCTACSR